MKKGVLIFITVLFAGFVLAQSTNPWTTDASGNEKSNFITTEKIYIKGLSICNAVSSSVEIFIASHKFWKSGDALADIRGKAQEIKTDASSNIPLTLLWSNPDAGSYDIIADCNSNGKYDSLENIAGLMNPVFIVKGLAGKGTAKLGSNNPGASSGAFSNVDVMQINLKSEGESIMLNNIGLSLTNNLGIEKAGVYIDENGNGKRDSGEFETGSLASPGKEPLLNLNYSLNGEKNFVITLYFSSSASGNYSLIVNSISGTGKNSNEVIKFSSVPLKSNVKTIESGCIGNLALAFSPNPADSGASVSAKFSGLSKCSGKSARVQMTPCSSNNTKIACSCILGDSGCDCKFKAESFSYIYYGCIDKNNDKDMADAGETILTQLAINKDNSVTGDAVKDETETSNSNPINMNTLMIIIGVSVFTLLLVVILIFLIIIASRLPKAKKKNKEESVEG
jgi:hypothetical protein